MLAKDYVWQTYEEVEERINSFACGIVKLYKDATGNVEKFRLGVYSQNNPEYVITDYASSRFSNTLASLYDTLDAETSEFILNHA
ncbi:UNVERIFIED_CONTAM: hypothetical protein HDU68_003551 [Siphonaria sp. JEL0065]|nr:hypothetical protein HDU68_003551 [Siphonaria sp. JEL0065]